MTDASKSIDDSGIDIESAGEIVYGSSARSDRELVAARLSDHRRGVLDDISSGLECSNSDVIRAGIDLLEAEWDNLDWDGGDH